jgi:hypothetical protein
MATTIVTKSGSGAPTASNLVAGELAVDLTNKRLYTENSSGTVLELGTNPASDVTFGDNTKAVFGDGSDLRIYHTGSHSTIENIGTGHLQIHTTDFRLKDSAGTESMILANADGNVQLYYDNAEKLATTATGIDVTGSVTASAGITATTGTFSGNVASSSGMSITKTGVSAIAYDTKTGTNASSAAVTWYDGVNVFATDGSYEIKGTTGNGLTLAPTTGAATFSGTVTANGAAATAGLAVASDGSALNTIQVQDTRALAADVGGSFVFQALQDGAGTLGTTAAIVSGRLNATSGNTQGYLTFLTGQSGGLTEGMRLDASGNVGIGTSTITSGFKLEVTGDARFGDAVGDDAVELGWSAGGSQGFIQAYDRNASAFRPLILNNSLNVDASGDITSAGQITIDSVLGNPVLKVIANGGGGAAQITLQTTGYTSAIYQYQGSIYHSTTSIRPAADNGASCGGASFRWTTVYAVTGTINTSDAREKTAVAGLTANELEASKLLGKEIGTYKWLASIAEKGEGARTHIGMTVQRAIEIMESCNLDPMAYGFICYDEWEDDIAVEQPAIEAQDAVLDEDGEVVTPAIKAVDEITKEHTLAGNRYGFRYDQLNQFIAAGFNARLEALES